MHTTVWAFLSAQADSVAACLSYTSETSSARIELPCHRVCAQATQLSNHLALAVAPPQQSPTTPHGRYACSKHELETVPAQVLGQCVLLVGDAITNVRPLPFIGLLPFTVDHFIPY